MKRSELYFKKTNSNRIVAVTVEVLEPEYWTLKKAIENPGTSPLQHAKHRVHMAHAAEAELFYDVIY